jgi:hypothetical protein
MLHRARGLLITLMMEAASTSETSVNFYQTTQRSIPEDSHLHAHSRQKLKSHLILLFVESFWYLLPVDDETASA